MMAASNTSILECVFNRVVSQPFDVEFNIGTQRILAHRTVLGAVSTTFEEIFSNQDGYSSSFTSLTIAGMELNEFLAVLEFAYNGSLSVDQSNAEKIQNVIRDLGIAFCCTDADAPEALKEKNVSDESENNLKPRPTVLRKSILTHQIQSPSNESNKENDGTTDNKKTSEKPKEVLSPKRKPCKNCNKSFFSARHLEKHERKCVRRSMNILKKLCVKRVKE